MSKTLFLTLSLAFTTAIMYEGFAGLGISEKSSVSLVTSRSSRPAVGLRWSDASSRNQVTFTPATPLLVLVGSLVPISLGLIAARRVRLV
jgi:hypothetical protein